MNSSESGPLDEVLEGLNPTQALLGLRSLTSCVGLLLTSSKRRLYALKQLKSGVKVIGEFNEIDELRSALPNLSADEYIVSISVLNR